MFSFSPRRKITIANSVLFASCTTDTPLQSSPIFFFPRFTILFLFVQCFVFDRNIFACVYYIRCTYIHTFDNNMRKSNDLHTQESRTYCSRSIQSTFEIYYYYRSKSSFRPILPLSRHHKLMRDDSVRRQYFNYSFSDDLYDRYTLILTWPYFRINMTIFHTANLFVSFVVVTTSYVNFYLSILII